MSEEIDKARRHFLTVATVVAGAVGTVMAAVPLVSSMEPSARTKALGGPVDIDVSKIEPGSVVKAKWRQKPVWVVQRSQPTLAELPKNDSLLRDPTSDQTQQPPYCKNAWRSIKPELLVIVPICTHLGCIPLYRPEPGDPGLGTTWPGGFFCPCHGSKYDLAGRVFFNVPAPLNLPVPVHRYLNDKVLRIGEDPLGVHSSWTSPEVW
ncbi:MAG: ubiquinol-cytochrome c reductase iron-sulfur subunit [Gammaproteobacteria bacterium]|nr:ubiquinol-cytochrome c reductase iron-sulfur subunit [Gammaproteobacteria bacterium]